MIRATRRRGTAMRAEPCATIVAACIGALLSTHTAAFAQGPAPTTRRGYVEEIIVTAQKREQKLIDVPTSVVALGSEELRRAQVRSIADLLDVSTNLSMANTTDSTAVNFFIRGIGTGSNELGLEQAVGIFVDGVYRGRPAAAVLDMIDLERIEVLRGPQATLFGRNNTAGSINMVTANPTREWSGVLEAGVGDHSSRQLRAMLSGPITDWMAFRIAAGKNDRNTGEIENVVGTDAGGYDRDNVRGQLLFDLGDATSLRLTGDRSEAEDHCCVLFPYFVADVDRDTIYSGATLPGFEEGRRGTNKGQAGSFIDIFDRVTALDGPALTLIEDWGVAAELESSLLPFTDLTIVGSWRDNDSSVLVDGDGTDSPAFSLNSFPENEIQESYVEARLASSGRGRFDWLIGYNFFRQVIIARGVVPFVVNDTLLPPGVIDPEDLLPPLAETNSDYAAEGHAGFGELTWHLFDVLHLTGGMRYLGERKKLEVGPTRGVLTTPEGTNTIGDGALIGSASVAWDLAEARTVYLRFARGYKAGGTNLSSFGASSLEELEFDPEIATNYEAGGKMILFDSLLALNFAVFHQTNDNQQVLYFQGLQAVVLNAARVISKGVEAELEYRPAERFSLRSGLTYLDATYDSFPDAPGRVDSSESSQDLSGHPTSNAPTWTVMVGGQYTQPLLAEYLDAIVHLNARYKSKYFSNLADDEMFANDDSVMLGGGFDLASPDRRWSLQFWGKNLLDEELFTSGVGFPLSQASTLATIARGRTLGATASVRF